MSLWENLVAKVVIQSLILLVGWLNVCYPGCKIHRKQNAGLNRGSKVALNDLAA